MKKNIINPWTWQNNLGYAQAVEVKHNEGTLYCSGQAAIDAEGKPIAGNMEAQIKLCLHNLETLIAQAGYLPANIVRLNFYTTSIKSFFEAYGLATGWLKQFHCTPASTLVQVQALAFPELLIEMEATVAG